MHPSPCKVGRRVAANTIVFKLCFHFAVLPMTQLKAAAPAHVGAGQAPQCLAVVQSTHHSVTQTGVPGMLVLRQARKLLMPAGWGAPCELSNQLRMAGAE